MRQIKYNLCNLTKHLRFYVLLLLCNLTISNAFSQETLSDFLDTYLDTGWYKVSKDSSDNKYFIERTGQFYFIDKFKSAKFSKNRILKLKVLEIYFDSLGTKQWEKSTEESNGNQFAFIFENTFINVPLVNSKITTGHSNIVLTDLNKEQIMQIKKSIKNQIKKNNNNAGHQ